MHPGHWMLLRPCLVYAAASDMGCRKTEVERETGLALTGRTRDQERRAVGTAEVVRGRQL